MATDFAIPEALRGFGSPVEVHTPSAGSGRTSYFIIGAVFVLLSMLTVVGVLNPPANHPPPAIVLISLTGVFLGIATACFGVGSYTKRYTLILFPDALVRTGGPSPEIFRWTDIAEIYTFVNPVAAKHRIVTQDGRKLEIDNSVKDGKKLGEAVRQTVCEHMLPAAMKAFDVGETLTFGPLRLNQGFLYYNDKQMEWKQVEKVSLLYNAFTRSMQFEVRATGSVFLPWCVVPIQNIPNVDVFKRLVERKKEFTK